jgi:hypothetical protein
MSYRIDPNGYCSIDGCSRPKLHGEEVCALCLVKVTDPESGFGSSAESLSQNPRELQPEVVDYLALEAKLPRCVAYLSQAGDVITLELTGEPKFTEADVEIVASALSSRSRKAA